MPDKDPIEKFLEEIAKTLELTEKGKKALSEKGEEKTDEDVSDDIKMKLMKAKAAIEIFVKLNTAFIPPETEKVDELKNAIENPHGLPDSGRHIIEQSKKLQQDVEIIQKDINAALTLNAAEKVEDPLSTNVKAKKNQKEKTSSEDKDRRKKFRRMKDTDRKI